MLKERYVAFLRGINVGGRTIKMEDLKNVFEDLGFSNVKTILASGNVIFESDSQGKNELTNLVQEKLKDRFGHVIDIIIQTMPEIQQLVEADPFAGIHVTPGTRLFVTFISETSEKPKGTLKIPYSTEGDDLKILSIIDNAVCSVLSPTQKTPDLMNMLEKEYGKKVTTRNWNTVMRVSEEK